MKKIILLLTVFFVLCTVYAAESVSIYKVVTHATKGMIGRNDPIVVIFGREVPQVFHNRPIKDIITADGISGSSRFVDAKRLEFRPADDYEAGKSFSYRVHPKVVFPDLDLNREFLEFDVTIPRNTVEKIDVDITGDFPQGFFSDLFLNSSARVAVKGVISFSEPIDKKAVQKSFDIKLQGSKLRVNELQMKDKKNYLFFSKPFMRTGSNQEVKVVFKKDRSGIIKDINKKLTVPAVDEFRVVKAEPVDKDNVSVIRLTFSEKIPEN